ncbi:MAG: type VI secretion system baseplate subunit TssE [Gammaproteobacteria bacterium]|nr:MAG: type VI secretion system baseplate subunit TssE [Gammaproteobacteria bacterium]
MAELTPQERLQPSLLDRLTDKARDTQTESRDRRVLSMRLLRQAVLRDLAWLLNTGHLETTEDLEAYPQVRDSVLNYGMPDISGISASNIDTAALERSLRDAIVKFEPRISPDSLRVSIARDKSARGRNAMLFTIEGQLWAEPTPMMLYLKTEIDLETGDIAVTDA